MAPGGPAEELPRSAPIRSTGDGRDGRVGAAPIAAPGSEPRRDSRRFLGRRTSRSRAAPLLPPPTQRDARGNNAVQGMSGPWFSTAGFPTVAAPVRWRQSSSQPSPAPFGTSSIWDQPILPLCGRRAPSPGVAALSFPCFLAAHPAGRMPRCIEQLETLPWRKGRRPDSELGSRVAAVRLSASFWPTLGSAAAQTPTMAAQNVATWRGITVFEGLSLCPATNTRMVCKGFELPAQLPVQQNRSTAPALRWRFPCRGSRITAALK